MACSNYTLKGITAACKDSIGGIKAVYVALREDVPSSSITIDTTGSTEADKTYLLGIASTEISKFKKFAVRKASSAATSTLQTSETSGNSWQTELTLQFMKQDAAKRLQVLKLCSEEAVVVFVDGNGKGWYLGYDYPVEASAATAESGTAMTDLNGYNLTLTDNSVELPYQLDETTLNAILAL